MDSENASSAGYPRGSSAESSANGRRPKYVGRRGGAKARPLSERLWEKVQVGPGCWEWLGAKNSDGYPVLWDGTRLTYAYRIVYEMIVGPIGADMELDHLCRQRWCVNPGHCEAVSKVENIRRMWEAKRSA